MKMQIIKFILGPIVIFAMAGLALAHGDQGAGADGIRRPDLPPECSRLEVKDGSERLNANPPAGSFTQAQLTFTGYLEDLPSNP